MVVGAAGGDTDSAVRDWTAWLLAQPAGRWLSFVFAIIGVFLIFAAIDSNAHEATGFAGALMIVKQQPFGTTLLVLVTGGLFAFGAFGIAEAAFRRIDDKPVWWGIQSWLRA